MSGVCVHAVSALIWLTVAVPFAPAALDISNDNYVLVATAYDFILDQERFRGVVEVRQKNGQTALIVYQYCDAPPPAWWQDANLLYSSMPDREIAAEATE